MCAYDMRNALITPLALNHFPHYTRIAQTYIQIHTRGFENAFTDQNLSIKYDCFMYSGI